MLLSTALISSRLFFIIDTFLICHCPSCGAGVPPRADAVSCTGPRAAAWHTQTPSHEVGVGRGLAAAAWCLSVARGQRVLSWGLTVRPRGKGCQELWQQQLEHITTTSSLPLAFVRGFSAPPLESSPGVTALSSAWQEQELSAGPWGLQGRDSTEGSGGTERGHLLVPTHREGLGPQTACGGAQGANCRAHRTNSPNQ